MGESRESSSDAEGKSHEGNFRIAVQKHILNSNRGGETSTSTSGDVPCTKRKAGVVGRKIDERAAADDNNATKASKVDEGRRFSNTVLSATANASGPDFDVKYPQMAKMHTRRQQRQLQRRNSASNMERTMLSTTAQEAKSGAAASRAVNVFSINNLYFYTLERSWSNTWLLFVLVEVSSILFCTMLALLPGVDLVALGEIESTSRVELALQFSANNVITMGLGNDVMCGSRLGFAVGLFQCLFGVLLNVLVFAIIVTKFQKPAMKLMFADKVCFATRDGAPCVLFRVGNLRCNVLHDLHFSVALVRRHVTAEGEGRILMTPLETEAPPLTMNAVMTFVHYITDESPLNNISAEIAREAGIRLQCVFSAHDPVYESDKYIMRVYAPESFSYGTRFGDVMEASGTTTRGNRDTSTSKTFVNFAKFNNVKTIVQVLQARPENAPKPAISDMHREQSIVHVIAGGNRASYADQTVDGGAPIAPIQVTCLFSAKVMFVLSEAGLPYRAHIIDMYDKPAWMKSVSPRLETPTTLLPGPSEEWTDSSAGVIKAMAERYAAVDELVNGRLPLNRSDDTLRMWAIWKEAVAPAVGLYGDKALLLGSGDDIETCAQKIRASLLVYDRFLIGDAPFMCGDKPGMLDITFGPVLEFAMNVLESLIAEKAGVDLETTAPRVCAYRRRMRPRFKGAYGGGGNAGGCAMVRYVVAKALKMHAMETERKMVLFRKMLEHTEKKGYRIADVATEPPLWNICSGPTQGCLRAFDVNSPEPVPEAERTEVLIVCGGNRASYGDSKVEGRAQTPITATCLFSTRVCLIMAEAKVPFRAYVVDMFDKPDWLASVSPKLETPATLLPGPDDTWSDSSSNTIHALAERYPTVGEIVNRVPLNADADASSLWMSWKAVCDTTGLLGGRALVMSTKEEERASCVHVIKDAMLAYESFLVGDAPFMCGDAPGLLDFEMATVLHVSVSMLEAWILEKLGVDLDVLAPRVMAYRRRMSQRDCWRLGFGGGGSDGRAELVRYVVQKGPKIAKQEGRKKSELYASMLQRARHVFPPPIASNEQSKASVVSHVLSRPTGEEDGSDGEAVADVKLCV